MTYLKSLFLFTFLCPLFLYADLNNNIMNLNKEEVIIDPAYMDAVSWDAPSFPSRKPESDITRQLATNQSQDTDWQGGQLAVLKEIPYSYPQLSDRILQLRTLSEIEGSKAIETPTPEEEAYSTGD